MSKSNASEPLLLNLETATDICSVCISRGNRILCLKEAGKKHDHAAQITLLIEACCRESGVALSQLDAVAISRGPGSYTALRIGASVAKGICYALEKPLIAIDTLPALAGATQQKEKKEALYCPMIDARRMEVYTALFDQHLQPLLEPQAMIIGTRSFSQYFENKVTIVFSGNGAEKCRTVLTSSFAQFSPVLCSARHLAILAQEAFHEKRFVDIAYFSPFYLKPPNITTPKKIL